MDPLRIAIALVPLSAYLSLLGVLNLRRQPVLVSGANDLAALGLAITGWVFVGPIELFRPETATLQLGAYVWLLLLGLYWLCLSLVAMVIRPSMVIYNISLEELRPAVAEAVAQVDPDARWAGDSLTLPRLRVQLHLDAFPIMRQASLVSSGGLQDLGGWFRLKRAMERSLGSIQVRPNPRSVSLLVGSVALFALALLQLCSHPTEVAQSFADYLAF